MEFCTHIFKSMIMNIGYVCKRKSDIDVKIRYFLLRELLHCKHKYYVGNVALLSHFFNTQMFCIVESNILQQVHADMSLNEHIYNEMLLIIENKVFAMVGKKLNDF